MIKRHEGLRLRAYLCPANVWTIGYGHTSTAKEGMLISEGQAEELLKRDLRDFEIAVIKAVIVPLTQHQFDALVSLTYNIGAGAFTRSTLVKRLNEGDYAGAACEFDRWNKGGGRVLPGLVKRRDEERKLFLS
jgi:lysozyme